LADTAWMVRCDGGALFEKFHEGYVAVGWPEIGDLSAVSSREAVRARFENTYPEDPPGRTTNSIGVLYKIRSTIAVGDPVVTYDPESRQYLVGRILGEYTFAPNVVGADYPHVRSVLWEGPVGRDSLSAATRNSLGSIGTLFALNEDATAEVFAALKGEVILSQTVAATKDDLAAV
jgi:restriction system protein